MKNCLLVLACAGSLMAGAQTPNFVFQKKLCGADAAASDQQGYAVHMYKNNYIVGDPRHDINDVGATVTDVGAAYIYEYSGGSWTSQKISAPYGGTTDLFGSSVAISDSFAVVGAVWNDYQMFSPTVYNNIGAAYIYKRDASTGTWSFYQKLSPQGVGPSGDIYNADDWFGQSVSISGNTIVVGALYHDYDTSNTFVSQCGAAFIFEWNTVDMQFEYKQKIFEPLSDRNDDDYFGTNVQVDGDVMVVGTPGQDLDIAGSMYMSSAGAAHIFERNSSGNWVYSQKITAPYITGYGTTREANAGFGTAVAVQNGSVVVAAPFTDMNLFGGAAITDHGLVFTYNKPFSTWGLDQYIQSLSAENGANFGNAVSIYGNQLLVGSCLHDRGAGPGADLGRVDLYLRNYTGGTWTLSPAAGYSISPATFGDQFGKSVSIYGNKFVAGALNYDVNDVGTTVTDIGSAFVFCGPLDFDEHPTDTLVCEGDTATFDIHVYNAESLQWYESPDGGTTWVTLTDNLIYSGTTTSTLHIANVTTLMHLHQFYCVAVGECVPVYVNSFTAQLSVNARPSISFSLADNICIDAATVNMSATPTGGFYTGAGVSGSTFDPGSAGLGVHDIVYAYTEMATGCSNTHTESVVVRDIPTVTFTLTDDQACSNESVFTIGGASPTGGTFSGSGVSGSTFDPSVTGAGTFNILYTYIDAFGCDNAASDAMLVVSAPVVTLFLPNDHVCNNAATFILSGGLPAGGVYSGSGVSGGNFNPAAAGLGTTIITYQYTDMGSGCQSSASENLTVDNCSGITEVENQHLVQVYPNPANQQVLVVTENNTLKSVRVMDETGRQVMQQPGSGLSSMALNTAALPEGIYLVMVETAGGNVLQRLVVLH